MNPIPRPPREMMREEVEREQQEREATVFAEPMTPEQDLIARGAEAETRRRERAFQPGGLFAHDPIARAEPDDEAALFEQYIRRVPCHGLRVPCGNWRCLMCGSLETLCRGGA